MHSNSLATTKAFLPEAFSVTQLRFINPKQLQDHIHCVFSTLIDLFGCGHSMDFL